MTVNEDEQVLRALSEMSLKDAAEVIFQVINCSVLECAVQGMEWEEIKRLYDTLILRVDQSR